MTSNKNIFFFSFSTNFGGAERVLLEIEKIASKKYKTNFIINSCNIENYGNKKGILINNSYKISNSFFSTFYFLFYSLTFIKYFRQYKKKVYYCNDLESLVFCIPLKIFTNGKLIWHIHDIYNFNRVVNKGLFKILNFFVDEFISITHTNMVRIRPYVNKNIHVINNFSRYTPVNSHKTLKIDKQIVFGYVGQITKWKRVDLIIDSFLFLKKSDVKLNNYILKIIGKPYFKDDIEYYTKLKNLTINCNSIIWEDFNFHLNEFYDSIDYLLAFSINEPFGLVILESMSYGVPVISTLGDGPTEIINTNNGFLIRGNSEKQIKDDFIKIDFSNSSTYSNMSKNALDTIYTKFTKEQFTLKINNLLDKL